MLNCLRRIMKKGCVECCLTNMYGTRDAAQNWEWSYAQALVEIGFKRGVAIPCLFYCEERNVRVAVHGDDFTIFGDEVG